MSRVMDLIPGDVVEFPLGNRFCYVNASIHPLWPHLVLVVWRAPDGSWELDALSWLQEVGTVVTDDEPREVRLRAALTTGLWTTL